MTPLQPRLTPPSRIASRHRHLRIAKTPPRENLPISVSYLRKPISAVPIPAVEVEHRVVDTAVPAVEVEHRVADPGRGSRGGAVPIPAVEVECRVADPGRGSRGGPRRRKTIPAVEDRVRLVPQLADPGRTGRAQPSFLPDPRRGRPSQAGAAATSAKSHDPSPSSSDHLHLPQLTPSRGGPSSGWCRR